MNILSESFVRMEVSEMLMESGNIQEASGMDMKNENVEDDAIQEGLLTGKQKRRFG